IIHALLTQIFEFNLVTIDLYHSKIKRWYVFLLIVLKEQMLQKV
uniref:Uncharacterized protein n=1 Tax=Globisporangium ultimum (strain ATCC 200006 / CBS 805.95 / DAOM BR144) TaxID=431595 RepID=K3XCQ4_GLOUD